MIDIDKLKQALEGIVSGEELTEWLRNEYMPEVLKNFESHETRRLLALYDGDIIPQNERNLTDVRNRVSLILEYEFARISNDILRQSSIADYFWTYVVANRFPDLEVRNKNGIRSIRFEVKCLQSVSEEKSANFDTLIKDVNPVTDFLVVFLWEWSYLPSPVYKWDRAPRILSCYVFPAYQLALLRDFYWLNRPPETLGDGYQGFDLIYAVNCRNGVYSHEEGNYGKLTRFWSQRFQYQNNLPKALRPVLEYYQKFLKEIVGYGLKSLAYEYLPLLSGLDEVKEVITGNGSIAYVSGKAAFVFGQDFNAFVRSEACLSGEITRVVRFTDKYEFRVFEKKEARYIQVFENRKPKNIKMALDHFSY